MSVVRASLKGLQASSPIADVVDAPIIGNATAGAELATVAYTASTTGGTATSFTAISTPGSITGTGASPITVSGLTGGTAYTFKVYGTNAAGVWSGVQSVASSSITPSVATSFQSIATVTPSSGSSSITFSSIPSTYASLQLRMITGRSDDTQYYYDLNLRFNSDTTSNYNQHWLFSDGSTVTASGQAATYILLGQQGGSTYGAATIVDIHDYASTTKLKTVRSFNGTDRNGAGYVGLRSGLWRSTSAVSSITISNLNTAGNSVFSLYGIKGA